MATSFSDGWPVETALCRVELRSYEGSARAGGGAPRLQRLTAPFHGNPNTRSISSWKNLAVYCFGPPFGQTRPRRLRHASLQYFTCSQSRAHFRRHRKGRWHTTQFFSKRPFFSKTCLPRDFMKHPFLAGLMDAECVIFSDRGQIGGRSSRRHRLRRLAHVGATVVPMLN